MSYDTEKEQRQWVVVNACEMALTLGVCRYCVTNIIRVEGDYFPRIGTSVS